ncbi:hypothetical protein C0J52_19287 [Blattella germanica]|nr:hypothetical protein C0J52_19287 [Blattella germanica]
MLPLDNPYSVIWVREGRDDGFNRRIIQPDGGLTLTALERDDAGIYACTRQIDVYCLDPNTTYVFKIWASNKLGPGEETVLEATTLHDIGEIELARHLLEGAQTFDTRVWVAAVAVVMGTLLMLAIGTCYLLYKDCHIPSTSVETGDEKDVKETCGTTVMVDQVENTTCRTSCSGKQLVLTV